MTGGALISAGRNDHLPGMSKHGLLPHNKSRLDTWLADFPGKTAADFADVAVRSATYGPTGIRTDPMPDGVADFQGWQNYQNDIALGYEKRVGINKFRLTDKGKEAHHTQYYVLSWQHKAMRAAWSRDHPTRPPLPEDLNSLRGAEADYFDRWLDAYKFSQQ